MMKVTEERFYAAGLDAGFTKDGLDTFWIGLRDHESSEQWNPLSMCFYCVGATIVMFAMSWIMEMAELLFGGVGIFILAVVYATVFSRLGLRYWDQQKKYRIPAGLFITMAVCMMPLAIHGIESYLNIWPMEEGGFDGIAQQGKGRAIPMTIGTIIAAIIALRRFPFSFLIVPILASTWLFSIDIAHFFTRELTFIQVEWISIFYGVLLLAVGYLLDRKKLEEFGFWSYLLGTLAITLALSDLTIGRGEFILFANFFINILLMALSLFVRRCVLMIAGALGVFSYLTHLVAKFFPDGPLAPFLFIALGVLTIYFGILYQKNLPQIEKKLLGNRG